MKNKTFLLITCTLILTLFLFSPVKMLLCELGYMSITKIGNEFNPELREDDSWYTPIYNSIEAAKAKLNDLYCNYLPYYNDLVVIHGSIEQSLNEPVYTLLDSLANISAGEKIPAAEIETLETADLEIEEAAIAEPDPDDNIATFKSRYITTDATHRYYMFNIKYDDGTSVQALERVAILEPEKLHERMDVSVSEMVRITEYLSTRTDVYVYSGSRFQDSPVLNEYLPDEYSTEADRDQYLEALSPYASTGYLHLDSMNDRISKMFFTDHHWNHEGMREGYTAVHDMIAENWPDISNINTPQLYTVEGIKNYGSFARLSNTYAIFEGFSFYDYNLAAHNSYGGSVEDTKAVYLAKRYDNSRGVAHYESFYPHPSRVVYPENNTGRNLLVIGDSFSRGFVEYIGSHFDTTVVRPIWDSTDFNLEKVLDRYKITDVVILLYSDRMMYNLYEDLRLEKLITP